MKDTSLRSDGTRTGESKTEIRNVRIRLMKRKLRFMKRIQNYKQRILTEMLRKIRRRTLECRIWFEREKEYPAYAERITEKDSGKIQKISSVYDYRISGLLQRKLWKTKDRKLSGKSTGLFGQKVLIDRKEVAAGTNRRILIKSEIVPPKISCCSEVFA